METPSRDSHEPHPVNTTPGIGEPNPAPYFRRSVIVLAVMSVWIASGTSATELSAPLNLSSPGNLPAGLSSATWAEIHTAHRLSQRTVTPSAGGHQAKNPGQQWSTDFDGRGFLINPDKANWKWGLKVRSYGFSGAEKVVAGTANSSVNGTRLDYIWDENLSEWFVNDGSGLEHGFTLKSRPSGAAGPLQIVLDVRGDLHPEVEPGGLGAQFLDRRGVAAVTYRNLTVFDADNRMVPATLESVNEWRGTGLSEDGSDFFGAPDDRSIFHFGGPTQALRVSIDDRGARYPLTVDPLVQQAYLKASNSDAGDAFGAAVAVSGDTVVVGANAEDSAATSVDGDQTDNHASGAGAAYVFQRVGATWVQQAYLKASNADAGDAFGTAVAISGDTIVVGAYLEDGGSVGSPGSNSASASGAAYVFVRQGTSWSQQAYLKASNVGVNDYFGAAVAISGDTIVVGAPLEDSNSQVINGNQNNESAPGAGAAYVFVRNGTSWTQQAYLKAANAGANDVFGASVAASDGTVIVGAYLEASSATGINGNGDDDLAANSGAVYVFVREGAVWKQQAYLKASNTGQGDFFGNAVALAGNTAIVGAVGEDSNGAGPFGNPNDNSSADAGAAYIFVRTGAAWKQEAYLKAPNVGGSDHFGYAVALSGNVAAVGANGEDSSATGAQGEQADDSALDSGAVYVFSRVGTAWSVDYYLKAANTGAGDTFGGAVGLSGTILAVGAPAEDASGRGVNPSASDNNALDSGAVYLWDNLATVPSTLRDPTFADSQFFAWIQTEPAKTYFLEYVTALAETTWVEADRAQGNGTVKQLTDPTANGPRRFYRARIQ